MIERLLAAQRALDAGQLEVAERLYGQVEAADPRNAIAMTGRAKVARAQGDLEGARRHVARALETDPDDQAANALAVALRAARGEAPAPPPAAAPRPSIVASIGRFLRRLTGR